MSFDNVPSNATLTCEPFEVSVPQQKLDDLATLLRLCPLAPLNHENAQEETYGVSRKWMEEALKFWKEDFDWRAQEKHMNDFPHFKAKIEGLDIHFVALFSSKPDAIPILFNHGWPGSFLEFLPLLSHLKELYPDPSALPYHVIVPSLPGYGFSSPPPVEQGKDEYQLQDVARVLNSLMVGLGFGEKGYVSQGGDLGSMISRALGVGHDECKGVQVNFCHMDMPQDADISSLSKMEQAGLLRAKQFDSTGSAYAKEHATRPATIGFALSSSPVAALAWIGEKFVAWSHETPSLTAIIESIALYWLTDSIATSVWPYRTMRSKFAVTPDSKEFYISKPMGYSWFRYELAPIPKAWAAKTGNLVHYREHETGGHFAALEKPEVLWQDVDEFVQQVWGKEGEGGSKL